MNINMDKKKWMSLVAILAVIGFWAANKFIKKTDDKSKVTFSKMEGNSYWTCPMHPQVHLDHAGECPICHMKLVKVAEMIQERTADTQEKRSTVLATNSQLELMGVQKTQVEKMTLNAVIPVSGRMISANSVAFQIYEKDLRDIHTGLTFSGEGSTDSQEEISGIISSVDSIVDPTSRTVRVIGNLKRGSKNLISETSFRGEIKLELKDRIAIPESSVLHTGASDLVYIFSEGNKLAAREVKLGAKAEGFYEVLSGLNVGDFISSGPNFLIDSEAKIRGTSDGATGNKTPECPSDQHWDIPMAMCMPGKANK